MIDNIFIHLQAVFVYDFLKNTDMYKSVTIKELNEMSHHFDNQAESTLSNSAPLFK